MERFEWVRESRDTTSLYLSSDEVEYGVCIYSAVNNSIWSYPLGDWFGSSSGWVRFQHRLSEEDVAEVYCVER